MNNHTPRATSPIPTIEFLGMMGLAVFLAIVRYWIVTPQQPWNLAVLYSLGLVGAAFGSQLLWHLESLWMPLVGRWIPGSIDPEHPQSPFRHALLLVLLPLLGFFVLTSSQTPVGLGFVWGILVALARDAYAILRGNPQIDALYFGDGERDPADFTLHRGVVIFYLVSTLVLTLGIMVW